MIRLEIERRRADLRQAALGRECRPPVNPATISAIEHGRINPSASELARLAEALGFDGDPATLTEEVQVP